MLVRDESGFKVWCSLPSSIGAGADGAQKGSRVSFTVTIEPSRDDPKFGFGKRPAKFEIIPAAPIVNQVCTSIGTNKGCRD